MLVKLSTQTVLQLVGALNVFDGLGQTQPGEKVKAPYKLAGSVRMAMAKNLAKLNEIRDAYQKARTGCFYVHADGLNQFPDLATLPADERIASIKARTAFEKEDAMLQDVIHEVNLVTIKESELRLEDNDIPVAILSSLWPMVDGMHQPDPDKKPNFDLTPANDAPQPAAA